MRQMNSTERHAELVAAGWRVRLDGRRISPDPNDARYVFTLAAAWHHHQPSTTTRPTRTRRHDPDPGA
jgi:hypothetical protein